MADRNDNAGQQVQVGQANEALTFSLKWTIFSKIISKKFEVPSWGIENTLTGLVAAGIAFLAGSMSENFDIAVIFWLFGILVSASGLFPPFLHEQKPFYTKWWGLLWDMVVC